MVYVNFKDDTKSEVVSSFASPQSPDVYLFLGEVEEDDQRYLDYLLKYGIEHI